MSNLPDYIKNTEEGYPYILNWTKVVGPELHPIQMYDIIYDERDLKLRRLI